MGLLITLRNLGFCLIYSIVSDLLDQLQIIWQLYLIELLEVLIGLRLLDISKAFDRFWHADLLHKPKAYGTFAQVFGLVSSFLSNWQLRVVLDGKPSQDYPVTVWVLQGSILGPALFLLYINDLPDGVICKIAITDDATLYSNCDQASDL